MPGNTWRTHADGSEFAASDAVHTAYDRALRNADGDMAAALRADVRGTIAWHERVSDPAAETAELVHNPFTLGIADYYRSEQDPETVARETVLPDIPGYAEYPAFVAAEGLDDPADEAVPARRNASGTHLVCDMASDVVWHGGVGHRFLSTDEGVSCYRCGMTATGDAVQESIPDCQGPESGGDHVLRADGYGGNECTYGCRDFARSCDRNLG